jgi:hypothetical protein
MSNPLDPESMTPAERIAEAARILGRGVARLKEKRNHASKSHLLPRTRQSEVCSAQAGTGNRPPVSGTGGPPARKGKRRKERT